VFGVDGLGSLWSKVIRGSGIQGAGLRVYNYRFVGYGFRVRG
jgi:hypothetical protein